MSCVPLVAEQELSIGETGKMLLQAEGSRFTAAFAKLDYRLTDLSDDRILPLSNVLLKSSSSGLSRSRLSLRSFNVELAGTYRLVVLGLDQTEFEKPHNIVVSHDRRGKMILKIVELVVAGIGLIGGFGLSVVLYIVNT